MDTETLRATVRTHAERLRGKVWPNGLGFDIRRWEYTYSEVYGCWQALLRGYDLGTPDKLGRGPTPEAARNAATPQKD
jgi:hypothetical protein